jgi:hypothetical protein
MIDHHNGTYTLRCRCSERAIFIPQVFFDEEPLGTEDHTSASLSQAKRLASRVFVLTEQVSTYAYSVECLLHPLVVSCVHKERERERDSQTCQVVAYRVL